MHNQKSYPNAVHLDAFMVNVYTNKAYAHPDEVDALTIEFLDGYDLALTGEQRLRLIHVAYDWASLQANVLAVTAK